MKGKETKVDKEKSVAGTTELKPWPNYIEERIKMFDKLKEDYAKELEARDKTAIKITLPDGKSVDGFAWQTTAYDVAKGIRFVMTILFN